MSDPERWWLALAVFSAVVVVVAVLLGLVIAVAKSIDRRAGAVWSQAKQIAENTVSLWLLEQTNEEITAVRESARALEQTIGSMNGKLAALAAEDGEGSGIARKVKEWVGSAGADPGEPG
ncbi:MAG: hypothetical protein KY462_06015 [Actinobacteria bacterium]|nr:hypothetical protein [Actinomycetota bacterium]